MEIIIEYGMFLAKAVTIVVAILIVFGSVASVGVKNRRSEQGQIEVENLNDHFESPTDVLNAAVLDVNICRSTFDFG